MARGDRSTYKKVTSKVRLISNITDRIDTQNTTDTGMETMRILSPTVTRAGRKIIKVTVKGSIKVATKANTNKKNELELEVINQDSGRTQKVKVLKGSAVRKRVASIKVDGDIIVNRNQSSKSIATKGSSTTIKKGIYNIYGYRAKKKLKYLKFKHTTAKVNENDTGNTSYEAIQNARRLTSKSTNTVRGAINVVTATRHIDRAISSIGKPKVHVPVNNSNKIKTGRYIDTNKKRTLEGNRNTSAIVMSKKSVIHNDVVPKKVNSLKTKPMVTTSAKVNKNDTSNTGIEAINSARVGISKVRNTARRTQNTYVRGKRISNKIRTRRGRNTKINYKKTESRAKKVTKTTTKAVKQIVTKSVQVIQKAKVIMNPVVIKGGLIIGAMLLFISMISAIASGAGGFGAVSYSYIMADVKVIVDAKNIVDNLNAEATQKIDDLLKSEGYDDTKIEGNEKIQISFQDILAIIGVEDEQEYKLEKINVIHDMFYKIDTEVEVYQEREVVRISHGNHEDGSCTSECIPEYELVEKRRLIVKVEQYNFVKIMEDRGFDKEEQDWGMNLASCDLLELYPELADLGITAPEGSLTDEELEDLLGKLPTTGATRENIVAIAENLVGKIAYGWGSKADPPTIPSQLDCSGFTDYVFKLAGAGTIGAGTYGQWDKSVAINKDSIQIGDLGFLKPPNQASDSSPNHVGIFVGYDSRGNMMFVHCQGGTGTVKTTAQSGGFKYFRRPLVKFAEE